MGYSHHGIEMYINRNGHLRKIHGLSRTIDRIKGFGESLLRFRIDHLSDHSIDAYVDALHGICERRHGPGDDNRGR